MSRLPPSETFDQNAREALGDDFLRGALRNATGLLGERRRAAIAAVPGWEDLRRRAQAIKDEALRNLDHYLVEFAQNAERRGATVHWAPDADAARRIVAEIAQASSAKTIVKSKSMTTEEIHLNDALEAAGFEVVETDLGEWIIQLADEPPSHIIAPAIHKTRRQIAEVLRDESGMAWTEDPARMTEHARQWLRQRFAAADLGVSGVNFAVAETGSILIVENEGNIRFTTSLPRVHVAVMGIEKVIPRLGDLEVFLRLLPRSGTGQHLTTYQSLITGTAGAAAEGPEELHIVLLDAGRSRMLGHPTTRQSLACIRCGACLNACPVYQQVGGHAYGSVYPGPIGAVITPQLAGIEKAAQLPFASSLCGACREVCPVAIDIPALLLHLRGEITGAADVDASVPRRVRRRERFGFWVWATAVAGRRRYEWAARLARLYQRLFMRGGRAPGALGRRLAPPLAVWTRERDLRPFAERSFRERWPQLDDEETP